MAGLLICKWLGVFLACSWRDDVPRRDHRMQFVRIFYVEVVVLCREACHIAPMGENVENG